METKRLLWRQLWQMFSPFFHKQKVFSYFRKSFSFTYETNVPNFSDIFIFEKSKFDVQVWQLNFKLFLKKRCLHFGKLQINPKS